MSEINLSIFLWFKIIKFLYKNFNSKNVYFELFEPNPNCKNKLPAWFEVDHKIRLDQGGSNDIDNLVALCRNCHGKKTASENM